VKYQTIKGTKDRLPSEAPAWRFILETARVVLERFGAGEIHTPVFEDTGVFHKAVGESSDIVRKEMYSFTDKGERHLTLRPEATAPMVRAFLEHGFSSKPSPTKFWTFEPMFRAEKPQRGRERLMLSALMRVGVCLTPWGLKITKFTWAVLVTQRTGSSSMRTCERSSPLFWRSFPTILKSVLR
jgi:Histidyl-tRNA synthetase